MNKFLERINIFYEYINGCVTLVDVLGVLRFKLY